MAEGVPPFATYVPGADSGQNGDRAQAVRAVTIHTTEGPDSRGIGASRHHDTPGTFNFLNRDDGLYCYYPAHVRCSHAAGANQAGPGIENEGHTGTPLTPNQIANLGQLAHWLADTYGVPLTYRTGDPREWIDNTGFRGFIAHRAVDYPPKPSYRHFDEITPDEWAAAIGGSTGDDEMRGILRQSPTNGKVWFITGNTKSYVSSPEVLGVIQFLAKDWCVNGDGSVKPAPDSYLNALVEVSDTRGLLVRIGQFIAKLFPKKAERAGGAPEA